MRMGIRRVNRRFPGRLSVRVSRAQGCIVVRREVTLHHGVATITLTARRATSQYKQSPWRARAIDKSANRMAGDTGKPKLFIVLPPSRLDRLGRRAGESVGWILPTPHGPLSGRFSQSASPPKPAVPPSAGRRPGGDSPTGGRAKSLIGRRGLLPTSRHSSWVTP